MAMLSETVGYGILFVYWAVMIAITLVMTRREDKSTREGFLVARRQIGWLHGGPSIAASWIWAGALFVATQMAYQQGLAGLFWFLFPNVLALLIYVWLGPKIRERFNHGFTLPQYIRHKMGDGLAHKAYLVPFFFGQLIAITFNISAGAFVFSYITGIDFVVLVPLLALIPLTYTVISGIKASIVTDVVQMGAIIGCVLLIVPWAVSQGGGMEALEGGLQGIQKIPNMLDPGVAFSFGIVTSIGLISQTISDQQYWQRVFSIKKREIPKAFIFGAALFALVPLLLSALGFMAANPALGIALPAGVDPSLIGVEVVTKLLPAWVAILFMVALVSGLTSTIDSAISAASSLWVADCMKNSKEENELIASEIEGSSIAASDSDVLLGLEKRAINEGRLAMAGITVLGVIVAFAAHFIAGFGLNQLFLLSISIAASISVPTVLSLHYDRLSAKGVLAGVLGAIIIGMPLFIYANYINNAALTVAASVFMLGFSTACCVLMPRMEKFWAGWENYINKSKW